MAVRSLQFSFDSQYLATASDDTHIKLYDIHQAALVATFSGHSSWVLSVNFNPDNRQFVTR